MYFALAGLALLLLVSGWVWTLYFFGKLPPPPVKAEASAPWSLPAFALVVLLIGQGLFTRWSLPQPAQDITIENLRTGIAAGLVESALLIALLLAQRRFSLKDSGLHTKYGRGQLLAGGLAFLASLLPVYLLLLATTPLRSTETLHPFLKLLSHQPGLETVLWIGFAVIIVAPLTEELMYRVILQNSLKRWLPFGVALPMTAVIFSAVHGWPDMIPLVPLALILGWVYDRYQSYLAAVITHGLFNGWMLAWALLVPAGG